MQHSLRFHPKAVEDLLSIANWISARADPDTAYAYVSRVRERCRKLLLVPNGGSLQRQFRPKTRSVPFERSATILYRVTRSEVTVWRVLRRGRDVQAIARRSR